MWLSVILIVGMLVCLGVIAMTLRNSKYIFRIPFGIYFGWITIAVVANVTVLLVQMGVAGQNTTAELWTGIMIGVATLIASTYVLREEDPAYGFTVLWALVGILIKHLNPAQFNGAYPSVIGAVIFALVIIVAVIGLYFYRLYNAGTPKKEVPAKK